MKIIKPNMALGSKPTIISRARIYERKKKMIKKNFGLMNTLQAQLNTWISPKSSGFHLINSHSNHKP